MTDVKTEDRDVVGGTAQMSTLIGHEALRLMQLAVAADGHVLRQDIGTEGVVVLTSDLYSAMGGDNAASEITRLSKGEQQS